MSSLSRQKQVDKILNESRQNLNDRIVRKALEILDIDTLKYLGSVDSNHLDNNKRIILDRIPEPYITNWKTAVKKARAEIITKNKIK